MAYTLSWQTRVKQPKLVRHKWWAFWKRDSIEVVDTWRLRTVELSEEEGLAAIQVFNDTMMNPMSRLLSSIMTAESSTGEIFGFQLEKRRDQSGYIKTNQSPKY